LLFDIIINVSQFNSTNGRDSSPSVSAFCIYFVRYIEAIELVVACLVQNALSYPEVCSSFAKASRLLLGILCESQIAKNDNDGSTRAAESAVPSRYEIDVLLLVLLKDIYFFFHQTFHASVGHLRVDVRGNASGRPPGVAIHTRLGGGGRCANGTYIVQIATRRNYADPKLYSRNN
jgi:hypothetical protein